MAEDQIHETQLIGNVLKYWLCSCGEVYPAEEKHSYIDRVQVILFRPSGKYYTEEYWDRPPGSIDPYDMEKSPQFRRIEGGPVLVPAQEPWGFPALFPGVTS